jgi:hypothetical protein
LDGGGLFVPADFADPLPSLPGPEGEGPSIGTTNGRFEISDPGDMNFGWNLSGDAVVQNGRGVLVESGTATFSGFSQTFLIPANASALRFTIHSVTLTATPETPPDAFEAALLDAHTLQSLVPVAAGLSNTDAFLNLQASGELFFGSTTSVTGAATSGQSPPLNFPVVVTVDLTGVVEGTEATLYFDLLGSGDVESEVVIDNQIILGFDAPPLAVSLAANTDSGTVGDGITNFSAVTIQGTTDALATVTLDVDGDGFDDGQVTADTTGAFTFSNVPLTPGENTLRVQAGTLPATTVQPLSVTLDQLGPGLTLVSPAPGSTVASDLGYVDVQWNDIAGINSATFGVEDVLVTGVTVDRVVLLGNGLVRYFYNTDGDTLPGGTIAVQGVAGQVFDLAGNGNPASTSNFTVSLLVDAGQQNAAIFGNAVALAGARFSFAGNHNLLTATVDWGDGNVTPVNLPAGSGGGPINASHTYQALGVYNVTVRVVDNTSQEAVDQTKLSVVTNGCPWQNPFRNTDVDFDSILTATDAVIVSNYINARGVGNLPNPPIPGQSPPPFWDVDCNNILTGADAQIVVNELNAGLGGNSGEGEFFGPMLLAAPDPVATNLTPFAPVPAADTSAAEYSHAVALWWMTTRSLEPAATVPSAAAPRGDEAALWASIWGDEPSE